LKGEVERQVNSLGLGDRFTLTGWVDPGEVVERFKQCDILFMPSRVEAFPVTGVLALASGLAIVATRVSGYVDMVEHAENGFLYDPEDTEGMQHGLRILLQQPEKRQAAGRESLRIAKCFDIESIADEYESLFREILPPK